MSKPAMKGTLAAASADIQGLNRVMAAAPSAYVNGPESSGVLDAISGFHAAE